MKEGLTLFITCQKYGDFCFQTHTMIPIPRAPNSDSELHSPAGFQPDTSLLMWNLCALSRRKCP